MSWYPGGSVEYPVGYIALNLRARIPHWEIKLGVIEEWEIICVKNTDETEFENKSQGLRTESQRAPAFHAVEDLPAKETEKEQQRGPGGSLQPGSQGKSVPGERSAWSSAEERSSKTGLQDASWICQREGHPRPYGESFLLRDMRRETAHSRWTVTRKWDHGVTKHFHEVCCERQDWAVAPRGWKSVELCPPQRWERLSKKLKEIFWDTFPHFTHLSDSLRPQWERIHWWQTLRPPKHPQPPHSELPACWGKGIFLCFSHTLGSPFLFQISLGSQIRKPPCCQVLFCPNSPTPPPRAYSIEVNGIPASFGPVESQGDLLCKVLPVETDLFFNDLHLYPQHHFSKDSHEWTN